MLNTNTNTNFMPNTNTNKFDEIHQKFIEFHFKVLWFDIFPSFIIKKKIKMVCLVTPMNLRLKLGDMQKSTSLIVTLAHSTTNW